MVDKLKTAGKVTGKTAEELATVLAIAAGIAAACKVAVEPLVSTDFGNLPVWQAVAAIIFTLVIGYLWKLVHGRAS